MQLDAARARQLDHAAITRKGLPIARKDISETEDASTTSAAPRRARAPGRPTRPSTPPGSHEPPRRIVIQYPTPAVDDGRYPAKRVRRGHGRRRGRHLPRRPRASCARSSATARPGDAQLARGRDAPRSTPTSAASAGPGSSTSTGRAAGSTRSRPGPTCSAPGATSSQRKVAASQHDLAGELSEGVAAPAPTRQSDAKAKSDQALIEHAIATLSDEDVPESGQARRRARRGAVRRPSSAIQPRHGDGHARPAAGDRGRPPAGHVRRLVRAVPALLGRPAGRREPAPAAGRARLRRHLPAADPPDRPHQPQGPQQLPDRRPRRSRLALGDRRRDRRPRRGPPRPRARIEDLRRARRGRAASTASTSRSTSRSSARPTTPGCTEHPEWFHRRPDGTLKYAENPPKRYQDIYNVNWESPDWKGLWEALLQSCSNGWTPASRCSASTTRTPSRSRSGRWLIEEVHARDRDVVFLAEAFTKRAVMRHLAKIGFSQSYTYFTWKNSRWELTEYVTELAYTERAASTSAPTSSPTRPTSCTSTSSTAAGRRSRLGWCWPPR